METFSINCPTNNTTFLPYLPRTKLHPPTTPLFHPRSRPSSSHFRGLAVGCAKSSLPYYTNPDHQQEEEDWIDVELGKLVREKCKERRGVVEMLECLEDEAIMGDDQGKQPTDYNRRAQIFDRSSRVFQALKERTTPYSQDSPPPS